MRHKNKKSLKNLKQFRVRSKFVFYVLFRPIAQKWFFPIVGLILLGGILHHEATKEYTFENPKVAVVFDKSPGSLNVEGQGTLAMPQKQTLGSSTSTHLPPVRASGVIEAKIREAFPEDPDTAVAVFKGESGLNPEKESDSDRMRDGRAFSVGLAQINLTVSEVAGINCTKAFSGRNYNAKVINESLYKQCVEAAKDPIHSLESAKKKYHGRNNTFSAWTVYNNGQYEKFL